MLIIGEWKLIAMGHVFIFGVYLVLSHSCAEHPLWLEFKVKKAISSGYHNQ